MTVGRRISFEQVMKMMERGVPIRFSRVVSYKGRLIEANCTAHNLEFILSGVRGFRCANCASLASKVQCVVDGNSTERTRRWTERKQEIAKLRKELLDGLTEALNTAGA